MQHEIGLTAAFMMEGLRDHAYEDLVIADGGCIELVVQITQYAPYLASLKEVGGDVMGDRGFPGVFEYEVTSVFGKWFRDKLLYRAVPTDSQCREYLVSEAAKFFNQGTISESERAALLCALWDCKPEWSA